jgi:ligand-binding SRPBCC domain-containing protein
VAARAASVWAGFTTPEGVNDELKPILRLTVPQRSAGTGVEAVEGGMPLGRSRLLLFGLIPFGHIDIRLAELDLGRRFVERSSMPSLRGWRHERILEPTDDGCLIRDTVTFEVPEPLSRVPRMQRAVGGLLRGPSTTGTAGSPDSTASESLRRSSAPATSLPTTASTATGSSSP